jgi:hypothetical protein
MAEPVTLTLVLDLDRNIATHVTYDDEGESITSPTTVEELVLDLAAKALVDRTIAKAGKQWPGDMLDRVRNIRDEQIREILGPMVTEAVERSFTPTDTFGSPRGEPTTLRDEIVKQGVQWLQGREGEFRNPSRRTHIQQLIYDEVERAMAKELKDAMAKAKAEVLAAVQAEGARVLANTIASMSKG